MTAKPDRPQRIARQLPHEFVVVVKSTGHGGIDGHCAQQAQGNRRSPSASHVAAFQYPQQCPFRVIGVHQALKTLETKRLENPWRKHGNIPL